MLPGSFPSLVTGYHATALEPCAAAFRAAPLDTLGFVLPLLTPAFWKNYLVRITFGTTVDSSEYESRLHGPSRDLELGFVSAGIKPVLSR